MSAAGSLERNLRVQAMIRAYSDMELSVPILAEIALSILLTSMILPCRAVWAQTSITGSFHACFEPIWPASWKKNRT